MTRGGKFVLFHCPKQHHQDTCAHPFQCARAAHPNGLLPCTVWGNSAACVRSWEHRDCFGPSSSSPRVSSWWVAVAPEGRMKYTRAYRLTLPKGALYPQRKGFLLCRCGRGIGATRFSLQSHVVYVLPVGWQLFRRMVHGNSGTQMWNIRSNKIHTCF